MARYILYVLLILSTVGCVKNDDHINPISFSNIVGTYVGNGKLCIYAEESQDTICNDEVQNTIKIAIPKHESIRIYDTSDNVDSILLSYQKLNIINTQPVHVFKGEYADFTITLNFEESNKSIHLIKQNTNNSPQSYYFSGIKLK